MKNQTKKTGFTLTELLIYMGIFSIILVILTEMLFSVFQAQLDSEATSSVEQDSRFIVQRLIYDIQRASNITVSADQKTMTLSIDTPYVYQSIGDNLILNGQQLNSYDSKISNLNFQKHGNTTVSIGATLISIATKSSGPEVRNINTTIGLKKF